MFNYKEIINRGGLIGVNFLRAFVNHDDPNALYEHIKYGLGLGATNSICFGADYFTMGNHPDQTRAPFYFKKHTDATCYPTILDEISKQISLEVIEGISNKNALNYLKNLWK